MRDLTFTEKNEIDAKLCKCKECKNVPIIIQRGDLFNANDTTEYQVICRKCGNSTMFDNSLNKIIDIWNKRYSDKETTAHIPREKEFDIVLKMTNYQYGKMKKICTTPVKNALEGGLYKKDAKYVFNSEMEFGQPFIRVIVDTGNFSISGELPRVVLKLFPKSESGLRNPDMNGAIVSNSSMDAYHDYAYYEHIWLSEIFNDEQQVYTLEKSYPRKYGKNKTVFDTITYNFSVKKI